MPKSEKVTLAVAQKTRDGKAHKAGATVTVGADEARELIHTGRARKADAPTQAAPADTKKEKADG